MEACFFCMLMKVCSQPGYGNSKRCIVGNWTFFRKSLKKSFNKTVFCILSCTIIDRRTRSLKTFSICKAYTFCI